MSARPAATPELRVRPVTAETWNDFAEFFASKGCPHFCWCTLYRRRGLKGAAGEEKKGVMRALVEAGTPVGVLAYAGSTAVGWCSVAPRETYACLDGSRTMPRATPPQTSTWTILCFFVPRARRAQGIAHALLDGAVAYARSSGADVVEGYPFDSAGITATHRGHSQLFKAARFTPDGARWVRRLRAR